MKAFYINLKHAVARREQIESQKRLFGINIQRFEGIEGRTQPVKIKGLSDGQLGCLLSHLTILRNQLTQEHDVLIIEDDSILTENFKQAIAIPQYLSSIGAEWDIVYLDATIVQPALMGKLFRLKNSTPPQKITVVELNDESQAFGTHSYIINRNSIKKLVGFIEKLAFQGKAIDNIYVALNSSKMIKAHLTIPFLAYGSQETLNSQITDTIDDRIKTWLNIRRLLAKHRHLTGEEKSEFFNAIKQHLALFGHRKFGHFIETSKSIQSESVKN
jgi:GR25 family glycosyltransferase involved in LPS biosynthesis